MVYSRSEDDLGPCSRWDPNPLWVIDGAVGRCGEGVAGGDRTLVSPQEHLEGKSFWRECRRPRCTSGRHRRPATHPGLRCGRVLDPNVARPLSRAATMINVGRGTFSSFV